MEQGQAEKILEMGIQITSERNYDELLAKIIDCAMETTNCDGELCTYMNRNNCSSVL